MGLRAARQHRPPSAFSRKLRQAGAAAVFIAPAALLVLLVVLVPLLWNVWMSFHRVTIIYSGEPFVGFRNYAGQLTNPEFWAAVWVAFLYTIVTTAVELGLGLGLAILMNQRLRLRWLLRSIVILPWALPTIVNAMMWRWIDNADYGPLNALLTQTGILHRYFPWLADAHTALWMVMLADIWKMTPLMAILLLAALQAIDPSVREAAAMDGAGGWTIFRRIVLPMITPILLIALVLRTIEAFKVFDIVWIMTGGGPANSTQTVAVYAYNTAFQDFDFGNGAAISILIALFMMLMSITYLRTLGRKGA